MRYTSSLVLIFTCIFFTAGAFAKDAQPASTDVGKPEQCLSLIAIQDMTIIDNRTLLFKTGPNRYYVNRLPHVCHGLDRGNPIMYKTSIGMLCNLDLITVLDPVGDGFMPGNSCGLTKFTPITKAQAEQLKKQKRQKKHK